MTRTVASLIAGKPVDASATTLTIPNPANLDVVVAEAALADADTFLEACRVAKDAQRGWAATPAPVRGRAIQQFGRLVEDNFEALSRADHARDRQADRGIARRGAGGHRHLQLLPG